MGAYEIQSMLDIPVRAAVSEYAALSDACGCDVAFVNAVLDQLARAARLVEMINGVNAPSWIDVIAQFGPALCLKNLLKNPVCVARRWCFSSICDTILPLALSVT